MNPVNLRRFKILMNIAFITLAVLFLVLLFVFRGSMNRYISRAIKQQTSVEAQKSIAQIVDSAFNYRKNGEGFVITFLEFGATGCISCRKMEVVMKEIKEKYPYKVKVKFFNVLLPENQDMMKYFGIATIPTQVLMDSSGKEVFRHTGYFSTEELDNEIKSLNP
ncbi:MAG: thioredoxin family protein [Bacteroidetes bacterium]|nr:thioredoxin family protein [Bacteroidota bacterium]